MTEVLLQELTNSDINWMIATGRKQEIPAGTILVEQGKVVDTLYIILDGILTITLPQATNNPLDRAFAAIEGSDTLEREIGKLSSGEIVGEIPFINVRSAVTTVKAAEKSLVISICQQQLSAKLQQDIDFACRFYRAIAILLSNRITQLGHKKFVKNKTLRDMLFVLEQLHDSDIDWLIAAGTSQKIAANTVLIREGRLVDALYILLDGTITVSVFEDECNPLTRAFAALEGDETRSKEIARLSKGEIVGETAFIDSRLPSTTVKAIKDSLVLSIPRQKLAAKLQQDIGFASRFYRVIATLLANRLQEMFSRLGYGKRIYSRGQPLNQNVEYEDELDSHVLDNMALAGTKFDWILNRLRKI